MNLPTGSGKNSLNSAHIETHHWSVVDFERLVFDKNPQIAVFDCDGTLWSGDAGSGFMDWSLEQGLVSRSTADWIDNRHRAYRAGKVDEVTICGEMVQIYAGLREQELQSAAARYFNEFVRERYFPEMLSIVARLQQAGTQIWAVSSTNRWVIEEGVRDLGIPRERVLAAEVGVKDGMITSEIVDVPTGSGKAVSLRRHGISHPDVVFGNSIHDLAMLELAQRAFPVNPSPALIQAAAERGWGYYRPAGADVMEAAVDGEDSAD
jgi:phosphoserine phosphatase